MIASAKKVFSIGLKIAIVVFALWFIYVKITNSNDLKHFMNLIHSYPRWEIIGISLILFLLMLTNWGLECMKWRFLLRKVEPVSRWRAVESVFCGLTWAIFTPNRIGEYGGRVFFMSPRKRIAGIVVMIVGNIAQLLVTHLAGALALSIFIYKFHLVTYPFSLAGFALTVAYSLLFLVFYFHIEWLHSLLLSNRFTRRYKKFYSLLRRYKKKDLFKILLYSVARYAVFSLQYVLIFQWLIPGINVFQVLVFVCLLFFIQSVLPALNLLDVGIRSITALFLFGYITTQSTAVVAAVASIWFINLIIPAILGALFVFKLNFFGTHKRP